MARYNLDPERPIEVKKSLPEGISDRLPDGVKSEDERRAFFMGEALTLAKRAALHGDVPVGCVIVRRNEIIAAGENRRESERCGVSHAEIVAIRDAAAALGGWRLIGCEMFVTLEPCPMCAGAIMNSRIPRVYIGAADRKGGAYGGLFDLNSFAVNHRPEIIFGILESECAEALRGFFKARR